MKTQSWPSGSPGPGKPRMSEPSPAAVRQGPTHLVPIDGSTEQARGQERRGGHSLWKGLACLRKDTIMRMEETAQDSRGGDWHN